MKIIRNQWVPVKKSFLDYELITMKLAALKAIDLATGKGDCLELDFNPEDARKYAEQRSNWKLVIRQVSLTKWRVWKVLIPLGAK